MPDEIGPDYEKYARDLAKLKKLGLYDEIVRLWREHREPLAQKLLAACAVSPDPAVRAAYTGYMADGVIIGLIRNVEQSKPKAKTRGESKSTPDAEYPEFETPQIGDDDPLPYALGDSNA